MLSLKCHRWEQQAGTVQSGSTSHCCAILSHIGQVPKATCKLCVIWPFQCVAVQITTDKLLHTTVWADSHTPHRARSHIQRNTQTHSLIWENECRKVPKAPPPTKKRYSIYSVCLCVYSHTPTYITYSVYSRDSATLHFARNHQRTTVTRNKTQSWWWARTRGWAPKIKLDNGAEKWKHSKLQKTTAAVA